MHNYRVTFVATFFFALLFVAQIYAAPVTYTYDTLNRLTKIAYGTGHVEQYTYDANGNRLTIAATEPYTVTANANGTGLGSISSTPAGISYAYPAANTGTLTGLAAGSSVTLTATPAVGSWVSASDCVAQGGIAGGNASAATCTFSNLTSSKTVSATFSQIQYGLTVNRAGTGTGSVTPDSGSLTWVGNAGTGTYSYNMSVVLTATGDNGATVVWTGCNAIGGTSTVATCTVMMNAAKSVTATFTAASPFTLRVNAIGSGAGNVTSSTGGISFTYPPTSTGSASLSPGTSVTLTAASTSALVGWTGPCSSTGGTPMNATCTINNLNGNTTLTATFSACNFSIPSPHTVVKLSGGSGGIILTAANSGCAWTATSNVPWLAIASAVSGSGSSLIVYTVEAAPSASPRTGIISVAGKTFAVLQGNISKAGVFRNGDWYLDYNGNGIWDGCGAPVDPSKDLCAPLGMPGDTPVVGDWSGDGISRLGVFRNGDWYIDYNGNGAWGGCGATPGVPGPDVCMPMGQPTDIPVVGNWSGAGPSKLGLFRNGDWYLDYDNSGTWGGCGATPGVPGPDVCMPLGQPTDIPVVGDWNGDGKSELGLFRNGDWYLDYDNSGTWGGCNATPGVPGPDVCMPLGQVGDIPVVGDWNGDGKSKVGVFRNGDWYLDYNNNGMWDGCGAPADPLKDLCIPLGISGDIPVVGYW